MGRLSAQAMAEHVREDPTQLPVVLQWHLRHNHYPPLPAELAEPAEQAIAAAGAGDLDRLIDLPAGITFRDDRTAVTAREIVDSLHLHELCPPAQP